MKRLFKNCFICLLIGGMLFTTSPLVLAEDKENKIEISSDEKLIENEGETNSNFDFIGTYDENGLALVGGKQENQTMIYGMINSKGDIVIPVQYSYIMNRRNTIYYEVTIKEENQSTLTFSYKHGLFVYNQEKEVMNEVFSPKFNGLTNLSFDGKRFTLNYVNSDSGEINSNMYYFDVSKKEFIQLTDYELTNYEVNVSDVDPDSNMPFKINFYKLTKSNEDNLDHYQSYYTYVDSISGKCVSDIIHTQVEVEYVDSSNEIAFIEGNIVRLEKNSKGDILKINKLTNHSSKTVIFSITDTIYQALDYSDECGGINSTCASKYYYINDNKITELNFKGSFSNYNNITMDNVDNLGSLPIELNGNVISYPFGEEKYVNNWIDDFALISNQGNSEIYNVIKSKDGKWIDLTGEKSVPILAMRKYYKNVYYISIAGIGENSQPRELYFDASKLSKEETLFKNGDINPDLLIENTAPLKIEAINFFSYGTEQGYFSYPEGYYVGETLTNFTLYNANKDIVLTSSISLVDSVHYVTIEGKRYWSLKCKGSVVGYANEDFTKILQPKDDDEFVNYSEEWDLKGMHVFIKYEKTSENTFESMELYNSKLERIDNFKVKSNGKYSFDKVSNLFSVEYVDTASGNKMEDLFEYDTTLKEFKLIKEGIYGGNLSILYNLGQNRNLRFLNITELKDGKMLPALFDTEKKEVVSNFHAYNYDENNNMVVRRRGDNNDYDAFNVLKSDGTLLYSNFIEGNLQFASNQEQVEQVKINNIFYYSFSKAKEQSDGSWTFEIRYIDGDGKYLFTNESYFVKSELDDGTYDAFDVHVVNDGNEVSSTIDTKGKVLFTSDSLQYQLNDTINDGKDKFLILSLTQTNELKIYDVNNKKFISEDVFYSNVSYENGVFTVFKQNGTNLISALLNKDGSYAVEFPKDNSVLFRSAYVDGIAVYKTASTKAKSKARSRASDNIGLYDTKGIELLDLTGKYLEFSLLGNNKAIGLKADGKFYFVEYGDKSSTDILANNIILNNVPSILKVNDIVQVNAVVMPENAVNKSLNWSSSNLEVATVVDGKITALSKGDSVISVETKNGIKKSFTIKVTDEEVIMPAILNVKEQTRKDNVITYIATVDPVNATNKNVIWEINDIRIATVDKGKVTFLKEGSAILKVTSEGNRALFKVIEIQYKKNGSIETEDVTPTYPDNTGDNTGIDIEKVEIEKNDPDTSDKSTLVWYLLAFSSLTISAVLLLKKRKIGLGKEVK